MFGIFKFKKSEEGLKTKQLLDDVKQKLNNIQFEGEERIIFIIETLEKELISQGYDIEDRALIPLWRHTGHKIEIEVNGKRIGGKEIGK